MKVFFLGLDGLTLSTIEPYLKAGLLPNFKRVMENGACGVLQSTIPSITGPGWCSMFTGKKPNKHGVLEFRKTEGYRVVPVTRRVSAGVEAFWNLVDKDKKVIVVNVPFTYPPDEVNGIMVSGLMTPGKDSDYVFPKDVKHEILSVVKDYRIDVDNSKHNFTGDRKAFAREIHELTENRRRLMNYLLERKAWDLFFIVFTGPDRLQHILWDKIVAMDPQCVEYYRLLDGILGDVLSAIDDQTVLFIASDHGFQSAPKAFYINRFFSENGLLTFNKHIPNRNKFIKNALTRINFSSKSLHSFIEKRKLGKLKGFLPKWFVDFARKTVPTYVGIRDYDVDWDKTQVFSLLGYGMVSINLKGREPNGMVDPQDYHRMRETIRDLLLNYRDPESGKPVIQAVYLREQVYPAESTVNLPDLFAVPNEGYSIKEMFSKTIIGPAKIVNLAIIADHHRDGILMVHGKPIKKTSLNADICDVMPTLLYLMQSEIPEDVDGRVLTGIIDEEFTRTHEIRFGKKTSCEHTYNATLNQQEEELIKKHLRDLGYLG